MSQRAHYGYADSKVRMALVSQLFFHLIFRNVCGIFIKDICKKYRQIIQTSGTTL